MIRFPRMRIFDILKSKLGSSRGKIIANWSIYALGGFLPQALSVLLLPVFTRYLSPHDYGILSYTSMLCTFFTSKPVVDYATAKLCDTGRYAKFFHGMLERGFYFAPSQFEAAFVSTVHGEKEINDTIAAFGEVVKTL